MDSSIKEDVKVEDVIKLLEKITNTTAKLDNDKYIFEKKLTQQPKIEPKVSGKPQISRKPQAPFSISLRFSRIEEILNTLSNKRITEDNKYEFYDDKHYELLVRRQNTAKLLNSITEKKEVIIFLEDKYNKLKYEISPISDEYLLWIILQQIKQNIYTNLSIGNRQNWPIKQPEDSHEINVFDYLKQTSNSYLTLKIIADKKLSLKDFDNLTYTFLFQIAYNNTDLIFYPETYLEKNPIKRNSSKDEIDPPKRLYNNDLIQHYLLAVSAKDPVVIFLSHYHVIEHFFESVFYDYLNQEIKKIITNPGFSYNREKDINKLISMVKDSLSAINGDSTFKESEALKICLTTYIDLDELVADITQVDPKLLDYYTSKQVSFSRDTTINFNNSNQQKIYEQLANRIYKTRNAIVHSKERIKEKAYKDKYTPFVDDSVLFREIPLIQLISEKIIFKTSEEFKI